MDKIADSPMTDSAQPDEVAEPAETSPERPARDRTTRGAALVATLIALPVTVLVGALAFSQLSPDERAEPAATPSATTAGPRSTAPVEMAAPALAERPATVCRALLSQLPSTVNDLPQRPVTAGPEQNAAYGDPALTVACGGAEPAVGETDDVWTVNRVCWYATEQADATVLTTLDRETPVTVRVPRSYGQALQWVAPVSDTIVASVPSGGDSPSGCRN
ncbi:DUF3515 family protein [Micromonospora sp. C31]|uniref:DUF3515 family protein n=1 Tax=Micromonospora sp. C31 TaxID=2824876 RepID=UPI001B35D494|nr:DUF3515 family protein [Micromonospora sp. C31]MBQ1075282.1 DUF3515 family protein [Micromonospora sp. C31]